MLIWNKCDVMWFANPHEVAYVELMGEIEKSASRINLWTALIERFGKLAYSLGWEVTPAKLVNAVWPVTLMSAAMIWQHVPWYVLIPVAIFSIGSLLNLYVGLARARAVQGVKKVSLTDAAAMCEIAARNFYDYVDVRAEEVGSFSPHASPSLPWPLARAKEEEFMQRMKSRLGGDVGAAVAVLSSLGISVSSDFRSLAWADGLARFFGAQARLLRAGHLEEARKLDIQDLFY